MEFLQLLEKNILERAKIINESEKDDSMKSLLIALCKKDPVSFFKYFVFTDRNKTLIPERFGNNVPLLLFPYQEEFVKDSWDTIIMGTKPIEERTEPTDMFSEKSRQMGFSWIFAGLQLYALIFHNMKSLYISKKAEEVDKSGDIKSHFEKIRFMIRYLPKWMLPVGLYKTVGTEHNKYMNISRGDGTGCIIGESANPNAGRGGTFNFVIFDEMAFMEYAQSINTAVSSTTPCRFFNSTPNGEGNEYYRMRKLAIQQKLRYHRCHWTENPFYTLEWYQWKIKGMEAEKIAQELEIEYNIAIEGRVYKEYKSGTYNNKYNDYLPLYVSIDNSHGGNDPHAIIICQQDGHYWNIIEACEFNCSVTDMAKIMGKQPSIRMNTRQLEFYNKYKNYKTPLFIADPYDTYSTLNQSTIFEEYQKVGIFLNIPSNRNKQEQIMKTRANIHRLRVNEDLTDFNSAILNARYPQYKEGSARTSAIDLPIHDFTSHFRSSLEYLITFLLENVAEEQKIERIAYERHNPITGELQLVYN